jgi:TonB family protein
MSLLALALLVASFAQPAKHIEYTPSPTFAVGKFRAVEECGAMSGPEMVNSPTPILDNVSFARVSFIVGYDGQIYSPFILISNGTRRSDAYVLKVISTWRFHPATCNGEPVDAEGMVTFIRQ